MTSNKTFRYTKTARDQIALYSIDPYWLKGRIKEKEWKRKGKTDEYQVAFRRDTPEYEKLVEISKALEEKGIKLEIIGV